MKFKIFIVFVFVIYCLLPGISLAQNKVVVIPLVEEKIIQATYPCTGPDEVMSNGRCWKDRNLGASQVATSSTDATAYGDLYQWGRLGDGHQNRTSVPGDGNSAYDVPGHSVFLTVSSLPFDWRVPKNDILWQGLGGVNNPCPQGFRLPTEAEWVTERASWDSEDAAGAFASPLKLVVAGSRNRSSATVENAGSVGVYWCSKVSGTSTRLLALYSSRASMSGAGRANGCSIRCIKD